MFNFILFASLFCSEPETLPMPQPVAMPAYFEITVESRTPYSLFLNGKRIEANTCYKTEPLTEPVCVEIEIRFVAGDGIVKKTFYMDLEPGYKRQLTISVSAKPSYAWC